MHFSFISFPLLYLHCLFMLSSGSTISLKIDDSNSTFFTGLDGKDYWGALNSSNPCDSCAAKPDYNQVFMGTVHDGHGGSQGQMKFNGSSISVYGVIFKLSGATAFSLDDNMFPRTFSKTAPQFEYDVLLYEQSGLSEDTEHTLHFQGVKTSIGLEISLLDYAIVNMTDPNSMTSTSGTQPAVTSKIPAIVGGTVGGVLIILLVFIGAWMFRRRLRSRTKTARLDLSSNVSSSVTPFTPHFYERSSIPTENGTLRYQESSIGRPYNDGAAYLKSQPPMIQAAEPIPPPYSVTV